MKKICLDTDFIISLLRNETEAVRRAKEYDELKTQTSTTVMSAFEVYLGALGSQARDRNLKEAEDFFSSIEVLHLTHESAKRSSEITSHLMKRGSSIGIRDSIIAGITIIEDRMLVTRNISHFGRIPGLKIEKW